MWKRWGTSYHSGHLLVLAEKEYHRSFSHSTEAEVSIILSAFAIEGFFNEVAHAVRSYTEAPSLRAMGQMLDLAEESNAQPKMKLQIVHYALTGRPLDNGGPLAQDFDSLMALRNGLVHVKPLAVYWAIESDLDAKPLVKFPKAIRHLVSRKVIDLPARQAHNWRQLVCNPAVARWAHNVAVQTMKKVAEWTPEDTFAEYMRFLTGDLKVISDSDSCPTRRSS